MYKKERPCPECNGKEIMDEQVSHKKINGKDFHWVKRKCACGFIWSEDGKLVIEYNPL